MTQYKFQVSFCKADDVKHLPKDKNYVAIHAPYNTTAEELGTLILDGYRKLNQFLPDENIAFVLRVEADD